MKTLTKSILPALVAVCVATNITFASDWREKAVELAKAEPKIQDAIWSQNISFWVAVRDDGSDRSGYASYLCLTLNEAGKPSGEFVAISVWDHASMATDNPRKLGKAACK